MGPETQCCHLQDIDIFIGIMIKLFLLLGSALMLSSVIVRPAAFILDKISIEQLMQKLPAFEQSHFFMVCVGRSLGQREERCCILVLVLIVPVDSPPLNVKRSDP